MFLLLTFPILATLYCLPLIFGWICPNSIYGFRNARSRRDRETWYRANRIAGISILLAMIFCLSIEFAIPALHNTHAGHLTSVVVQISALIVANAWTTFRILTKSMARK
jgi:uncharacterized membrane protein